MEYDELGRYLGLSCPSQQIEATFAYDDMATSITEHWVAPDVNFTQVRYYEVNGLFVDSMDVETTRDGGSPTNYTQSYVRDSQHRIVQVDLSGSRVGSEVFSYDDTTGLLESVNSTWQEAGETWTQTQSFTWGQQDQLLTKSTMLGNGVSAPTQRNWTMTYDDLGRLASQSTSVDNGAPTVESFIYECDQTSNSSYFESCAQGPNSCPSPYQCTTTTPNHPGEVAQDVCLLPCDASTVCGPLSTCLCKGLPDGGQTDGPVPDGFCECG